MRFEREFRYYVFKKKDVLASLGGQELNTELLRIARSLPDRQFVVVESDWPEYEVVWKMIQDRMEGRPSELEALRARVARLEEALKRGVELHENCDADTCMCGGSMWQHPLDDHKPTAKLQYYGDQWAEEARRALEEK